MARRLEFMSKGTFGECLKREREMREVSLDEVSAATRIGTRFLQAMENEDWEKLPGGIFNRGFVRAVSRYLGLDEEDMLAEYDLAFSEHGPQVPASPAQPIPRSFPGWLPVGFLLLLAALIAGGFLGWRRFSSWRNARTAVSKSSQAQKSAPILVASSPIHSASGKNDTTVPAGTSSAPDSSAASDPSSLELSVATALPTGVRIVADGNAVFDGKLPAGESRRFRARNQFEVSASDSGGVLLELNGQTMPPLGAPGSPGKISLSWKDVKKEPGGTH